MSQFSQGILLLPASLDLSIGVSRGWVGCNFSLFTCWKNLIDSPAKLL